MPDNRLYCGRLQQTEQLGSLLLTHIHLKSSMDKKHAQKIVGGETTYPFPNFNGATVEAWEWINNFISHFTIDVYNYLSCLSIAGFKLIHVSKRGPSRAAK